MYARQGGRWWKGHCSGQWRRLTMARQTILETLGKTSGHLSAEEIYLSVHKSYPNIGLTTVYRNLEHLTRAGVVHQFDFGDGRARYELSETSGASKGHHHHLVCAECGRVIDYTDFIKEEIELVEKTGRLLEKKFDFQIQTHVLQFTGICNRCGKR